MSETTTAAHEYLRGSIKSIDAALDNIEDEIRRLRRVVHDLHASADDVQVLEGEG